MRFFIAICFVVILFTSCQSNDEDLVEEALTEQYLEERSWFDYLCSEELGGRYSGSTGIAAAVDYISNIIDDPNSLYVDSFPTTRCMMRNIIFHVDGEKDSVIVFGAHYDAFGYYDSTPLPGADDNLSGVVVLLKVIKAIQKIKIHPKYGIDICFFDGEEIGRHGSAHYLKECKQGVKYYFNIDTVGNPDIDLAFYYSKGCSYFANDFLELIEELDMSVEDYSPVNYITDCETFKYSNIPFICIVCKTLPNYIHKKSDTISHISFSRLDILAKGVEKYIRSL